MQGVNVLIDQINVDNVLKLVETDPKTGLAIWKLGGERYWAETILSDVKNLSYNPHWDFLY